MNSPSKFLLIAPDTADRRQVAQAIRSAGAGAWQVEVRATALEKPPVDVACIVIDENSDISKMRLSGRTPTVLLVSERNASLALRAIEAGASDYLVKESLDDRTVARCLRAAIRGQELFRGLRNGEAEFQRVFEACPDPIIVYRWPDGLVRLANERSIEWLGRSPNESVGSSLEALGLPDPFADCDAAPTGQTRRVELLLDESEHSQRAVSVAATGIEFSGETCVLAIVRDATERYAVEALRRDMVSMFSHDIKNPLGGILGVVDMLRDPKTPPEERGELVDMIESSAHGAITLAVNFVDADRIDRSELRLERAPVSLAQIAQHTIDHQIAAARTKGVKIEADFGEEDIAFADEPLFDRVIANLLSNAIKYTPTGTTVRIETGREGDRAILRVRDQGPGIAESLRASLFERYRQGEGRTQNSSGLGLFIVKTVADAHEATITLECPEEGGSVFTVSVPTPPISG